RGEPGLKTAADPLNHHPRRRTMSAKTTTKTKIPAARGKKAPKAGATRTEQAQPAAAEPTPAAVSAPEPANATAQRKAKAEAQPKTLSALDAAAKVLDEAGQEMSCPELIAAMAAQGYWTSPRG